MTNDRRHRANDTEAKYRPQSRFPKTRERGRVLGVRCVSTALDLSVFGLATIQRSTALQRRSMVAPRQTLFRHAIRGRKTTATFRGRSAAKNARDSATDGRQESPLHGSNDQFTRRVRSCALSQSIECDFQNARSIYRRG